MHQYWRIVILTKALCADKIRTFILTYYLKYNTKLVKKLTGYNFSIHSIFSALAQVIGITVRSWYKSCELYKSCWRKLQKEFYLKTIVLENLILIFILSVKTKPIIIIYKYLLAVLTLFTIFLKYCQNPTCTI